MAGFLVLALLGGCSAPLSIASPTAAPLATVTATTTITLTPYPSAAPQPTPTSTPDPTAIQIEQLHQASLGYIANTDAESFQVAHALGYSSGGDPANMCGPLAIAILQDAGLVSRYVDRRDFWLLDPRIDTVLLERTFPRDRFEWQHITQAINAVDYARFPLQAGDLLYIYAGYSGDDYFEHVLVVTHVDTEGRAYSVTNNYTDEGFVIQELMLYDPAEPGQGIFYDWTNLQNRRLGLTGFGGFDLWRPLHLPYAADSSDTALASAIDAVISAQGGDWRMRIEALNGKALYSRLGNYPISDSFAIRLPIAMLYFKALEESGITSPAQYAQDSGGMALLHSLLVNDNDEAAASLIQSIQQRDLDAGATLSAWNASATSLTYTQTTAEDMAALLRGLYGGGFVSAEARAVILDLMSQADGREDAIQQSAPEGWQIYSQNQMIAAQYPVAASFAILERSDGQAYFVIIYGQGSERRPATYLQIKQAMQEVAQAIWQYIVTK